MENYHWSSTSQTNLIGCTNKMIKVANLALEISNYDFGISRGLASKAQQEILFLNGLTELDGSKGNESAHQFGNAIDVTWIHKHSGSGQSLDYRNWNDPRVQLIWLEIGRSFLRAGRLLGYNVEWGLTYNINGGFDFYHFQIND